MRTKLGLSVACALSLIGCVSAEVPGDPTRLALSIGGGGLHLAVGEKTQLQATPATKGGNAPMRSFLSAWSVAPSR